MILDIPDELLDWRAKGFWLPEGAVPAVRIASSIASRACSICPTTARN